jgi:hypothetical protein
LVNDARIDLGLVINVVKWATSCMIVHTARAVVEANKARGNLMHLVDEVIFRVMEGLKDVVEVRVTAPNPKETFSSHPGQIRHSR